MKKLFLALIILASSCEGYYYQPQRERQTSYPVPGENHFDVMSDPYITQNIMNRIIEDTSLSPEARNVQVAVVDGVVTLTGSARSDLEKASLGSKANQVMHVRKVINQVQVKRERM